jgi:hypothetical protein
MAGFVGIRSQLRDWAAKGGPFLVYDAETGMDVTEVVIA